MNYFRKIRFSGFLFIFLLATLLSLSFIGFAGSAFAKDSCVAMETLKSAGTETQNAIQRFDSQMLNSSNLNLLNQDVSTGTDIYAGMLEGNFYSDIGIEGDTIAGNNFLVPESGIVWNIKNVDKFLIIPIKTFYIRLTC